MGGRVGEETGSAAHWHPVRWHRLNAGLTLDEVAARSGVGRNTLMRVEHGGGASHEVMVRLADALYTDAATLALRDGYPAHHRADVHELREAQGLSVLDLARRAGVSPGIVYRAEQGSAVHPRYALSLSRVLGCAVTDWYPIRGG